MMLYFQAFRASTACTPTSLQPRRCSDGATDEIGWAVKDFTRHQSKSISEPGRFVYTSFAFKKPTRGIFRKLANYSPIQGIEPTLVTCVPPGLF